MGHPKWVRRRAEHADRQNTDLRVQARQRPCPVTSPSSEGRAGNERDDERRKGGENETNEEDQRQTPKTTGLTPVSPRGPPAQKQKQPVQVHPTHVDWTETTTAGTKTTPPDVTPKSFQLTLIGPRRRQGGGNV